VCSFRAHTMVHNTRLRAKVISLVINNTNTITPANSAWSLEAAASGETIFQTPTGTAFCVGATQAAGGLSTGETSSRSCVCMKRVKETRMYRGVPKCFTLWQTSVCMRSKAWRSRKRVAAASSPAAPCKQVAVLKSQVRHACGCARPSRARIGHRNSKILSDGSKA
jgi:hypothetical protein